MKRVPLFFKTWLMTIISIILTIVLLIGIYSGSIINQTKDNQKKQLQEQLLFVKEVVKNYGVNESRLEQSSVEVSVLKGKEEVYRKNSMLIYLEDMPGADLSYSVNETERMEKREMVVQDGVEYEVVVSTYNILNIWKIIEPYRNLLPFFIGIGLTVSSGVAFIYSAYFSRRIKKLTTMVVLMEDRTFIPTSRQASGDELVQLENKLNSMYRELQNALRTIEDENIYIKKLEEDRVFFTRGATHELKTPIMSVMSVIEGLMLEVKGFDDKPYYYGIIYQHMQGMKKLVNEILELSQLKQIQEEDTCEVTAVLRKVLSKYTILEKEHPIVVLKNEKVNVMLSERNFSKVLSNLINNAIKYGKENEEIVIDYNEECLKIYNLIAKPSKMLYGDKLFSPFTSSHEDDDSHGLGLYFVKVILNQANYTCEYRIDENKFLFIINLI